MTYNEHRMLVELIERTHAAEMQAIAGLERKIHAMASSTNQGLAALQQVDSDLAQAVTDNTTAVNEAVADIEQFLANTSEDATVGSIAADLETKIAALKSATSALSTAVTPPASSAPAGS